MNGETIFWLIFLHIDARENSWPNFWRTKCCLHMIRGRLKSWSIYCGQKFVEYYDKIIWLQVACTLPSFATVTSYIYDLNVNSLRNGKQPHIRTSRSGWKLDKKAPLRWIKEWVLVTCEVLWLKLVLSSIFLYFNLRPLCLRPEPLWTLNTSFFRSRDQPRP